ncbi:hypothetical protein F2Q69_00013174 [Brassica cretica]|uniref:DUF4283 domain-containing protein n=1 Tax=Brassica cretica TaxID=69181 RepID=A0A8S9QVQ8_BRACR|nr:hypothetical protein F2Q69_00013174 [Brassica cretica]
MTDGVAVVDLPEEITKDPHPLWASYLVRHFISDAPHIVKVHATVNRLWTSKEKPAKFDAQFINPKTVLFCVEDKQIRIRVLKRHFWHIVDVPLVVQEWTPDTEASKPDLSAIPLWVDLKGVSGHLFSQDGLTFFGDTIGKTVKLHPNTVRCTRLDVARLLVVLNLEKPLPDKINIRGTDTMISVSYPWLPQRFSGCQKWGHLMKECRQITLGTQEQRSQLKGKLAEGRNDKDMNLPMTATDASGSVTPSHDPDEEHIIEQNETGNDNSKTTGSPSRFHLLSEVEEDEVEEGEVEASSTEEEEPYSLETDIPKEDPKVESKQQKGMTVNKDRNRGRVERQEEHQANKKKTKMPPHGGTNGMISLFAWNTRGFNKKRKHLYVCSWLQSAKPSFGCLIETRVQEGNSEAVVSTSLPGWKFLNKYDHHRLGKILVCWSGNVNW